MILRRLLHLIPVLLGVTVITFLMMSATPGDPAEIMLAGQNASAEQVASLRRDMGLDQPAAVRFVHFIGHALEGDFGQSLFQRRPVASVIGERLPATIELSVAALLIALLVAVPLGVLAGVYRHGVVDRLATIGSLLGVSMPGFWFGILLLILFAVRLRWLPVSGEIDFSAMPPRVTGFLLIDAMLAGRWRSFVDTLRHLVLPAITLALPMAAVLTAVVRASMQDVLRRPFVSFARAKGVPEWRVLVRHALRNAMLPVVSVAALETGSLLGGNMIVETVFGWPGLGRLVVESIFQRNYPLVQAAVLLYAVTYVLINLAADLLYMALNPRVRP
ncbi:MAG TPA: ABC transporter permease [Acetobacteraceae bacterium]|nr:ABC transporter permease [Acetobacteraceae bacterium]